MENKLYFRTKRDRNGNYYYRIIDLENKTITADYNVGKYKDDCIELNSRKELHKLEELFLNAGFNHKIIL